MSCGRAKNCQLFPLARKWRKQGVTAAREGLRSVEQVKSCKEMAKVSVKPLADRVLIKPMEAETKTVGGIYIPDTAKEKPQRGTVVAVGKGTKDVTMELKDGDVVLYGKYSGTEITIDDEDYLIMKQGDVLAVL